MPKVQTVVVPAGEAGEEFLRRLLMPTDGDHARAWKEAHGESPGGDIEIEEVDDVTHGDDCGCSKCYPQLAAKQRVEAKRKTAEAILRNRREDRK